MTDDLIRRQDAIKNYQVVCANVACQECPFRIVDGLYSDCRLEKFIYDLPIAQEITDEQAAEYCRKRNLVMITHESFETLKAYYDRRNE